MGRLGVLAIPLLLIALVVVAGTALWQRGDLNRFICDGDCGPSNVVAPSELTIAAVPASPAPTAAPGEVDPEKLSAAVGPTLSDDALGPRVGFRAISPHDGKVLATSGTGTFAPASTTKLLTAFATLATIDPGARFDTSVVRSGDRIVLVGGGDPYLTVQKAKARDDRVLRADLTTLARRTAAGLKKAGLDRVALGYDASLFRGPAASPAWQKSYVTDNIVTPTSALWADQGVENGVRSRDPAAAAADVFAGLLADRGITLVGEASSERMPAGAERVARVRSATVAQIVETLIRISDNQAAEVMLRHLAIAAGEPATFEGGTAAVRTTLKAAGVDVAGLRLDDGSGLARSNRISPTTLVETLAAALESPRTSGLAADLPVGGFTGTLVERFGGLDQARGTVRAKTGTLRGIHSLAGYAVDRDGRPVLFAVMTDDADEDRPLEARAALDRIAAAIASCRCG